MLKGLKGILEKGLQIAAPIIGGSMFGPFGAAAGSGIASLLTGNKPKDALMSAAVSGLGSMPFGTTQRSLVDRAGGKIFTPQRRPSQRQPGLFQSQGDTQGGGTLQKILSSFKPTTNKAGDVTGPGLGMQGLAALGPGILAYMAAKEDAKKAYVPDASEYMSAVDTMYGGQTARPPVERRIENLSVQIDPTTGGAVYRAGGGIMDITEMEEVRYPVGLANGGKVFPRRTGQISGPGTKTSDSIPAMLSDGEFVQRTDAVNGAGIMMGARNAEEARKKGADFMYALQDKLANVGKRI